MTMTMNTCVNISIPKILFGSQKTIPGELIKHSINKNNGWENQLYNIAIKSLNFIFYTLFNTQV